MKTTDCSCTHPGWCERHQCFKTVLGHWQCGHMPERFAEWERGEGVRWQGTDEQPPAEAASEAPGVMQRALNFGAAVGRHVRNGLRTVEPDVYEQRLAVCRTCELCDVVHLICRHTNCGCWLTAKARWASEDCPLAKWPALVGAHNEQQPPSQE